MVVEFLYVDRCPGGEQLLPSLRRLAEERDAELVERLIETADDAEAQRFLGSPTVRVDGVDVEPGACCRTDFGLKCRLYRTAGGISNVPAEVWVRDAVGRGRVPG